VDEHARAAALAALGPLDAPVMPALQSLVVVAATLTGADFAAVNVIDALQQHQLAVHGTTALVLPRASSMAGWSVRTGQPAHVADARLDPRWEHSPFVTGELGHVRMYASAPLRLNGVTLGSLCVTSDRRYTLDDAQLAGLAHLSHIAVELAVGRHGSAQLQRRLGDATQALLVDPLTGLPNRLAAEQVLARACRHGRAGLVYLDIDDFKAVNDVAGHRAGDLALQEVAGRLEAGLRPGDVLARIAGDEFVVVLPRVDSLQDLREVEGRLRAAVAGSWRSQGLELHLSASIGSILIDPGDDPVRALHRADMAMYRDKRRPDRSP